MTKQCSLHHMYTIITVERISAGFSGVSQHLCFGKGSTGVKLCQTFQDVP
jgi:hypothetical protein